MGKADERRTYRTIIPGLFRFDPSRVFPEGGWEIRFRDDMSQTRRRRFRTKNEALDFQASVRTDKRRGEFIDPQLARTPFRVVAERWFETTADLKASTRSGYRTVLDAHLLPSFGDRQVSKITPSEIKAMLTGSQVSIGTQRNVLRILSSILKTALHDGMLRVNPCTRVKLAPKPAGDRAHLTPEQVSALAREIDPRFETLVYFAAYTGMRAGEITALRLRSLDLLRGRARVDESVTDVGGELHFGPPKNGRPRIVSLPGFLLERLSVDLKGRALDDFVFRAPTGGILRHRNFYRRYFKPAVARVGLPHKPVPGADFDACAVCPEHRRADVHTRTPFRFHDLRHTAASLLIARGVHPKAVSEHLGHSSIAITMDLYGHLYPDHEELIVAALQDTYSQSVVNSASAGDSVRALPTAGG